jgi:isoleucyl-tRNA synthetase
MGAVSSALASGDWEQVDGERWRVGKHLLEPNEVLIDLSGQAGQGWEHSFDDLLAVSLNTNLDDGLRREGEVYDLIHRLNSMRRDAGLELTDRIRVTLPRSMEPLLEHADWIARETLATSVETGNVDKPEIEGDSTPGAP